MVPVTDRRQVTVASHRCTGSEPLAVSGSRRGLRDVSDPLPPAHGCSSRPTRGG